MELREGYKQTEAGIIPSDWTIKKIGDFTSITSGGTPSTSRSDYWGGEIKWMSSGELNYKRVVDVVGRITQKGLTNSATKILPKQCVLIGLAGQGKTRGTAAINYIDICTNQSIAAIHPSSVVSNEFLYHNLDNRYNELRSLSTGDSGRGGLNLTIIKNIDICMPSQYSEQVAIATALNDADNWIQSLTSLIAKKQNIKQGVTQELLRPKDNWNLISISKIGVTYGGLSGKSKGDFENGENPYIPFMNVMNNSIIDVDFFDYVNISASEKQYKAKKGDLFFNTSSETPDEVGMSSVLHADIPNLYLNSFCFGFRVHKDIDVLPLFLSYFFRSDYGREKMSSLAQGATRYNLSKSNFLKIEINLPKLGVQKSIAQTLFDMDEEISILKGKLIKAKQVKQGMMQNLLTGKIRLV